MSSNSSPEQYKKCARKKTKRNVLNLVAAENKNKRTRMPFEGLKVSSKKICRGRMTVNQGNQNGLFLKGVRSSFKERPALTDENAARRDEDLCRLIDCGYHPPRGLGRTDFEVLKTICMDTTREHLQQNQKVQQDFHSHNARHHRSKKRHKQQKMHSSHVQRQQREVLHDLSHELSADFLKFHPQTKNNECSMTHRPPLSDSRRTSGHKDLCYSASSLSPNYTRSHSAHQRKQRCIASSPSSDRPHRSSEGLRLLARDPSPDIPYRNKKDFCRPVPKPLPRQSYHYSEGLQPLACSPISHLSQHCIQPAGNLRHLAQNASGHHSHRLRAYSEHMGCSSSPDLWYHNQKHKDDQHCMEESSYPSRARLHHDVNLTLDLSPDLHSKYHPHVRQPQHSPPFVISPRDSNHYDDLRLLTGSPSPVVSPQHSNHHDGLRLLTGSPSPVVSPRHSNHHDGLRLLTGSPSPVVSPQHSNHHDDLRLLTGSPSPVVSPRHSNHHDGLRLIPSSPSLHVCSDQHAQSTLSSKHARHLLLTVPKNSLPSESSPLCQLPTSKLTRKRQAACSGLRYDTFAPMCHSTPMQQIVPVRSREDDYLKFVERVDQLLGQVLTTMKTHERDLDERIMLSGYYLKKLRLLHNST